LKRQKLDQLGRKMGQSLLEHWKLLEHCWMGMNLLERWTLLERRWMACCLG
jgi:hypothetical protein